MHPLFYRPDLRTLSAGSNGSFVGSDLNDLLAYLFRNAKGESEEETLEPASVESGEAIFRALRCASCRSKLSPSGLRLTLRRWVHAWTSNS